MPLPFGRGKPILSGSSSAFRDGPTPDQPPQVANVIFQAIEAYIPHGVYGGAVVLLGMHGFRASIPPDPTPPPAIVREVSPFECQGIHAGGVVVAHGFAEATPPIKPPCKPVIAEQTSPLAAVGVFNGRATLAYVPAVQAPAVQTPPPKIIVQSTPPPLPAGSGWAHQPKVAAPPSVLWVAVLATPGDTALPFILPSGTVHSAHGTKEPDTPARPAIVTTELIHATLPLGSAITSTVRYPAYWPMVATVTPWVFPPPLRDTQQPQSAHGGIPMFAPPPRPALVSALDVSMTLLGGGVIACQPKNKPEYPDVPAVAAVVGTSAGWNSRVMPSGSVIASGAPVRTFVDPVRSVIAAQPVDAWQLVGSVLASAPRVTIPDVTLATVASIVSTDTPSPLLATTQPAYATAAHLVAADGFEDDNELTWRTPAPGRSWRLAPP